MCQYEFSEMEKLYIEALPNISVEQIESELKFMLNRKSCLTSDSFQRAYGKNIWVIKNYRPEIWSKFEESFNGISSPENGEVLTEDEIKVISSLL